MATFLLIPGAGGAAWYWHRVLPLLQAAGHEAYAIDLPGDHPTAGLEAYAELVVAASKGRSELVLVAQSLGGFTAASVCGRIAIKRLVFVNAMIPKPGETAGAWWGNTQSQAAREAAAKRAGYSPEFDLQTYFLHDVPAEVVATGAPHQRAEADIIFGQPCAFQAYPDLPIHVVVGADDRFFPPEFQQRIARERLGKEVDLVPGGHLAALSHPDELAKRLLAYVDGSQ